MNAKSYFLAWKNEGKGKGQTTEAKPFIFFFTEFLTSSRFSALNYWASKMKWSSNQIRHNMKNQFYKSTVIENFDIERLEKRKTRLMVGWWWAGQQHKNVKEIVCLLKIVQISSSYLDFFTIVEVFSSFSSINVMENQCSLKCEKNQNKYAHSEK